MDHMTRNLSFGARYGMDPPTEPCRTCEGARWIQSHVKPYTTVPCPTCRNK